MKKIPEDVIDFLNKSGVVFSLSEDGTSVAIIEDRFDSEKVSVKEWNEFWEARKGSLLHYGDLSDKSNPKWTGFRA